MSLQTERPGPNGVKPGSNLRQTYPEGTGTPACHNLSMQDVSHLPVLVTGLAFVLAFVFGAVAKRVNFCTMGAITDVVNFGDWRRMRMWLLAIAVAIAGAAALQTPASSTCRRRSTPAIGSAGCRSLVGGFLFGFGMTLASGCGSKTLIRVGGGNLKSLVVLVFFAISAYMTLKGLFALWRTTALDPLRFDVAALGARTSDLPVDPRRARRRRRGQAVVAVRVRGGDRGLRVRRPRVPRDAAR